MLIIPGTSTFLEPPTSSGIVNVEFAEEIELWCSGSFVAPFTGNRTLYATCNYNNSFIVDGKDYEFSALNCAGQVYHTARRTDRRCGIAGYETLIEVGFEVGNRFLQIMDICHDERLQSTLYSNYILTPGNAGFQRSFPRPSFLTGIFFDGKNVDRLYTRITQKETIGGILGESRIAELFDDTRDIYLARGHLAAKADYIYGSQQRATFYFVNVAPQWQRFNGGNWERVESGIREFVAQRNIVAEMFTGTFGVLELKDVNGDYQSIYLSLDSNNNKQLPVPRLYYKVIFDTNTHRGIAIIGVNNPHVTPEEFASNRYTLCNDVSHLINWIGWNQSDVELGYTYACDVNEFARVVQHLPVRIHTTGLLY